MQFIISVYNPAGAHDEGTVFATEEEVLAAFDRVNQFNTALQEQGAWVSAAGLMGPATGHTITPTGEVTPGPFFESSHYLGGYWIIEAATEEEAIEWAKQGAAACQGHVELRQLQGE